MMLTADENVVRVNMNVRFGSEPRKITSSASPANNSLRQAMDSAVRGVIGQSSPWRKSLTANRTVVP